MQDKRVKGYPYDEVRQKERLELVTYEYDMPFNYPNITVWRQYAAGNEFHGLELATSNPPTRGARLTRVEPGRWTLMQTSFVVPPAAASGIFLISVAEMKDQEELVLDDAWACTVSEAWEKYDDIPAGAANLIANPHFTGGPQPPTGWILDAPQGAGISGGFIPPTGWKTDLSNIGKVETAPRDAEGRGGLRLKHANLALFTEFPVQPGQRMVFSIWAKSTSPRPKSVVLSPKWKNREGLMLNLGDDAGDCIIVEEEEPIVRLVVIGSACTPPGYVAIEVEPCEEFYHRGDMVKCTAPVRFRQNNLWGYHMRIDQWRTLIQGNFGYEPIPEAWIRDIPFLRRAHVKSHYADFPITGMSCAIFEIPKAKKVTIMGGSEKPLWQNDGAPGDDHYSFRMIRTTVASRVNK